MSRILSSLAGWKGYALLFALAYALGAHNGWTVRDWKADSAALKAAEAASKAATKVVARTAEAATITEGVARDVESTRQTVRVETRTIIEKVPVYVTVEADRLYPVPVGFVRLHDAAAAGSSATLPDGAGEPADAPSGLAFSAVARTVVGNYGQCLEWRAQLIGWQDWYGAQKAAWDRSD